MFNKKIFVYFDSLCPCGGLAILPHSLEGLWGFARFSCAFPNPRRLQAFSGAEEVGFAPCVTLLWWWFCRRCTGESVSSLVFYFAKGLLYRLARGLEGGEIARS